MWFKGCQNTKEKEVKETKQDQRYSTCRLFECE
jgi:hypothetical protein